MVTINIDHIIKVVIKTITQIFSEFNSDVLNTATIQENLKQNFENEFSHNNQ